MKYTIIGILSFSLIAASCSKQLDKKPEFSLDGREGLKSLEQVQYALNGAYNAFKSISYYGGTSGSASAWGVTPDIMGPDFIEHLESLGNWRTLSEWRYAADDGQVADAYSQAYDVIARANNVLNYVDAFSTGTSLNPGRRIKAQALAIRAHAHFDLMRYFATTFSRNSDSLGVAYVTSFDYLRNPNSFKPSRNTVKQCYDSLFRDLNLSLSLFRQGGNISTTDNPDKYFIDSTAVHAMLARINLYARDYTAAINNANIVIANRPLLPSGSFSGMWSTTTNNSQEVAWQIPNDGSMTPGFPIVVQGSNSVTYRVSTPMFNMLTAKGGVRRAAYVTRDYPGGLTENLPDRHFFRKYGGVYSSGLANFKVYRTGEAILIRAESNFFNGNEPAALNDLNTLRAARGAASGSETGAALLTAIFEERRMELLGEGHAFFDYKRTSRNITRVECGIANSSPSNTCSIGQNSRSWAWPIPFNEILVNSNMRQNPGY